MAVECPAPGCDYEGLVDQVAGHIGGRSDEVHDGMVPTAVREGGGGGGGRSRKTIPITMAVLAVILVVLVLVYADRETEGQREEERESVDPGDFSGA